MKWKAIYNLREIGCFGTFKEAFAVIHNAIEKEESLTWQLLETAIWIISASPEARPIYFYDARDIACEMGILIDGKLVD